MQHMDFSSAAFDLYEMHIGFQYRGFGTFETGESQPKKLKIKINIKKENECSICKRLNRVLLKQRNGPSEIDSTLLTPC